MMLRAIQRVYQASLWSRSRRLHLDLQRCEEVQSRRLKFLIRDNTSTVYGRDHSFSTIQSFRDYQSKVPIVDYENVENYIQRAAAGEKQVLTTEPILIFEESSGSTSGNKLLPCTAALFQEFSSATVPWLYDLNRSYDLLNGTTSYWSISPVTRKKRKTSGGIPIGFEDDTQYFGPMERWALKRMLAVSPEVARIEDSETWTDSTLHGLLRAENLGMISVWHPSFFGLLLRRIEIIWEEWILRNAPHRLAGIKKTLAHATLAESLWPRLQVVSCWGDGPAAQAMAELRRSMPNVRFQPKGLLATEGVVTFPLESPEGTRHVTAIGGHFLEFQNLHNPSHPPKMAHELEVGAEYAPLLSTGAGLYRYRLGDAVRCTGFHHSTPSLSFEGRMDQGVDLCGEKLNARQVDAVLLSSVKQMGLAPPFMLLAPEAEQERRYLLFVEGLTLEQGMNMAERVEKVFCESHGYAYARRLGQLLPIKAIIVQRGAENYLLAKQSQGKRLGQIKPTLLETPGPWLAAFFNPTQNRKG